MDAMTYHARPAYRGPDYWDISDDPFGSTLIVPGPGHGQNRSASVSTTINTQAIALPQDDVNEMADYHLASIGFGYLSTDLATPATEYSTVDAIHLLFGGA